MVGEGECSDCISPLNETGLGEKALVREKKHAHTLQTSTFKPKAIPSVDECSTTTPTHLDHVWQVPDSHCFFSNELF